MRSVLTVGLLSLGLVGCGTSVEDQDKWLETYTSAIDFKKPSKELKPSVDKCLSQVMGVALASKDLEKSETDLLISGTLKGCYTEELLPIMKPLALESGVELQDEVVQSHFNKLIDDMMQKDREEKVRIAAEYKKKQEKERLAKERYEHAYNGGIDLALPLYCSSYGLLDKSVYQDFSNKHIDSLKLEESDAKAFNKGMEDADKSLAKKPEKYFTDICGKVAAKLTV